MKLLHLRLLYIKRLSAISLKHAVFRIVIVCVKIRHVFILYIISLRIIFLNIVCLLGHLYFSLFSIRNCCSLLTGKSAALIHYTNNIFI
jgi:hypothetical protein